MIYWIASYPKSGNTWFRVFLSNLLSGIERPIDINTIGFSSLLDTRQSFDDILGWESSDLPGTFIDRVRGPVQESLPTTNRRIFKVHNAYLHPDTGIPLFSNHVTKGAFYIIRNPLDVAVSFANHVGSDVDRTIKFLNKKNAQLRDRFRIPQPIGSWSWHVRSWVESTNVRVHLLRYEDMLSRPEEVFKAACRFADLPASTGEISEAIERSSFERLREQEKVSGFCERLPGCPVFFRSGRAGSWRDILTAEQVEELVSCHREVMTRFGYIGADGKP